MSLLADYCIKVIKEKQADLDILIKRYELKPNEIAEIKKKLENK